MLKCNNKITIVWYIVKIVYLCSVIGTNLYKKLKIMTTIEKILKANGIMTTTEGVFGKTVIIAWDDLGINEEARFKIDANLKDVYNFLGH